MRRNVIAFLALALAFATEARADVPPALSFAGNLSSGAGPLSGPVTVTFSMYADPESTEPAALLWSETLDVLSDDGAFVATLGADAANPFPADLLDHAALFLGVQVEDDPEMAPRLSVGSVPFSMRAADAGQLGGKSPSDYAAANHPHSMSQIGGEVPAAQLPAAVVMAGEAGSVDGTMLAPGAVKLSHIGDLGCADQSSLIWLSGAKQWQCVSSWYEEAGGLSTAKSVHVGAKAATGDVELDVVGQARIRDSFPVGALPAYSTLTLGGLFDDPVLTMETASSAAYLAAQAATGSFVLGSSGGFQLKTLVPKAGGPLSGGTSILRATTQGWIGIGTDTPATRIDIAGDGSSVEAGTLSLRNVDKEAGLRLYDGASLRWRIFTRPGHPFPGEDWGAVLRFSPEYQTAAGHDVGLSLDDLGGVWVGDAPKLGELGGIFDLTVKARYGGGGARILAQSSPALVLGVGVSSPRWTILHTESTDMFQITPADGWAIPPGGSLHLSRQKRRFGIHNSTPEAAVDVLGSGGSFLDGFLFLRNKDNDSGLRLYSGAEGKDIVWHLFNSVGQGDKLRLAPEGNAVIGGITIDQTGKVGIGTTSPGWQLELSQNSAAKPGGGSWSSSSDRRLKKNIHTITSALERMLSLRGVMYEWRDPAEHGDMVGAIMGMIAQEVREVFPEWVGTDGRGFLTLGFIGFEALTVEAVRELHERNQALEAEVADLRARLDAIEARLE